MTNAGLSIWYGLAFLSWLIATRDRISHRQALLIGIITPFLIEFVLWLLNQRI